MNLKNIEVIDIQYDTSDYPDFCDSYIVTATWKDSGKELTEEELEELNLNSNFVYEATITRIF